MDEMLDTYNGSDCETQAILQFKSLKLRGKLGGDGLIIINNKVLFFLRNILRIFCYS